MSRYIFGTYVEGDLREIGDYIAKDSPNAARIMMMRFVSAFHLLARQPELGHRRDDLLEPAVRFWPVVSQAIMLE